MRIPRASEKTSLHFRTTRAVLRVLLLGLLAAVSVVQLHSQELSEIRALRDEGTDLMKARQFDRSQAKRDEALRLARNAIQVREKKFGKESAELIPFLQIAGQLSIAGEINAAIKEAMKSGGLRGAPETPVSNGYYQRALKIAEKAYGQDHPETADALDGYASRLGKAPQAGELFERAQGIRRRHFGEESPQFAKSLFHIGGWHASNGETAKGRKLLEQALAVFERTLKPTDLERFGSILDLLPLTFLGQQDFEGSRKAQQRVTAVRTRLSKGDPDGTSKVPDFQTAGITDPRELIAIHEKLLAAEENKYGVDTIHSFNTLSSLASEYRHIGDLAKAAQAIDRLVAMSRKKPGEFEALSLLQIFTEAADFYEFFGDYEKAQPLRIRILELAEAGIKGTGDALQVALISASRNHRALGENEKAAILSNRAIALPWPKPSNPMSVLLELGPLADLRFERGDYEKAAELYTRFSKIYDELHLGAMPQKGECLHRLGLIAHSNGHLDEAARYFRQARAIFAAPPPQIPGFKTETATSPADLLALAADETVLALERGLRDEALACTVTVESARLERTRKLLAFGSERQRLAFQSSFDPYCVFAAADRPMELAHNVLCYKGLVLDSLLEDRRIAGQSARTGQSGLYDELQRTKQELANAEFSAAIGKRDNPKSNDLRPALVAKIEELHNRIATGAGILGQVRRELNVNVGQVQKGIPVDSALIEFIRYRHPIGRRKYEARYGAVVIASNGDPHWIPLGSAKRLDELVVLYQKSSRGKTDEATLTRVSTQLLDQVWKPLAAALPRDTKIIAISPDGAFNSVSFAALADGTGRFLAEDFSIRYVASGRDLIPVTVAESAVAKSCTIFANPSFHNIHPDSKAAASLDPFVMRAVERRDIGKLSLPELAGTAREASGLAALASAQGWKPELHLGIDATEAALARIVSPGILHLATHGFILPETLSDESNSPARSLPRNPMLRSGLALAGAQDTLEAWKSARIPPSANDGILTAEEVGGLNLKGTWLVVLSACDTGSGEIRAGEGVLGLRRGFIQAGAQNLLMTLWPISDETTVQVMFDFYVRAFKTGNAPQALAEVQRDWLVKLRKDKGLLEAVRLAGPFIMTSQGKQR